MKIGWRQLSPRENKRIMKDGEQLSLWFDYPKARIYTGFEYGTNRAIQLIALQPLFYQHIKSGKVIMLQSFPASKYRLDLERLSESLIREAGDYGVTVTNLKIDFY